MELKKEHGEEPTTGLKASLLLEMLPDQVQLTVAQGLSSKKLDYDTLKAKIELMASVQSDYSTPQPMDIGEMEYHVDNEDVEAVAIQKGKGKGLSYGPCWGRIQVHPKPLSSQTCKFHPKPLSSKTTFHPKPHFIQNHFHPKPLSSHDHFHPKPLSSQTCKFHPKPLSSKTTFIQNHFHPKPHFIQNHFHPKPLSSHDHFHPKPLSSHVFGGAGWGRPGWE